jgi:hypothetical protein
MTRQRVHLRRNAVADVALRLLVTILSLALIFYGAMVLLAALKLSPVTIDHVSGYRAIDRTLSNITAASITGRDRIIIAAAGLGCLCVFGPLAWWSLPRPYLVRTALDLDQPSARGRTAIGPRAMERAAEHAAQRDPFVAGARARAQAGGVELDVTLRDPDGPLIEPLERVRSRVQRSLDRHGLPAVAIQVTLTAVDLEPTPKEPPS